MLKKDYVVGAALQMSGILALHEWRSICLVRAVRHGIMWNLTLTSTNIEMNDERWMGETSPIE